MTSESDVARGLASRLGLKRDIEQDSDVVMFSRQRIGFPPGIETMFLPMTVLVALRRQRIGFPPGIETIQVLLQLLLLTYVATLQLHFLS